MVIRKMHSTCCVEIDSDVRYKQTVVSPASTMLVFAQRSRQFSLA